MSENSLLEQFLSEGRELLDTAGQGLLQMERGEGGADLVNSVFRAVHTLKGTSGLFEVAPLTMMVHAGEDLLDHVRAGRFSLDPAMVDQLLAMLDQTRTWLDELAHAGVLPDDAAGISAARAASLRGLFAALVGQQGGPLAGVRRPTQRRPAWVEGLPQSERLAAEETARQSGRDVVAIDYRPDADCFFRGEDPLQQVRQVPDLVLVALDQADSWPALADFDPFVSVLAFRLLSLAPVEEVQHLFRYSDDTAIIAYAPDAPEGEHVAEAGAVVDAAAVLPPVAAARPPAAGPATLRVDQVRIDSLMNLIGELIVAKNSLSYLARKAEAGASARELARDITDQQAVVNRLAEEMQSAVMAIRMLPVSHVFQRFPRLVRDVSRQLGKQVGLDLSGQETAADKNMIEALGDPLMHMVRNSLDHGLETPEERLAAGKPPIGMIWLAAEQANESIVVTIRDDGRGIDPARVRRKAVERGLLDAQAAASLSDAETLRLVFAPGFSTAEQVSQLSGRGVGMDVVRSAVEKAGGHVDLDSRVGEGTTVRVTLPLSLAITRILTIECAGHLFGIPMNNVVESVRLPRQAVRRVQNREAFVLRDRIIPLLRLADLLDLPVGHSEDAEAELPVLVLRCGGSTVGLAIDAFRERMEAIVRPLEGVLEGLKSFMGTTLLGDGRVLLILDVAELL
jgi:two-component system chemotaxis sensor kinase CheA